MVIFSLIKDCTNKIIYFWLKVYTFLSKKIVTIYKLKDIFNLDLPGFNKKQILLILSKEIKNCKLRSKSLTILLIEIDYFQHYVESFGVEAGNNVINAINQLIKQKTRDSDMCFSNDKGKFIIIFPAAIQQEVVNIASRVRDIVTKQGYSPYEGTEQVKIKLTVSIGSASTHCNEENYQYGALTVLKKAQSALLEGKKKGINQIHLSQ